MGMGFGSLAASTGILLSAATPTCVRNGAANFHYGVQLGSLMTKLNHAENIIEAEQKERQKFSFFNRQPSPAPAAS